MTTTSSYQPRLSAPSQRAKLWLAAVGLLAPVIILIVTVFMIATSSAGGQIFEGEDRWMVIASLSGSLAFCVAVFLVMRHFMARRSLQLTSDSLTVTTSFYRRQIALSELDLSRARIINLDEKTELKPLLKTNGFYVPGFRSGWFRTRSFNKALVAMLDGPKVVWLPTRLGYEVMLEVEQPQQFLDTLKDRADQKRSQSASKSTD